MAPQTHYAGIRDFIVKRAPSGVPWRYAYMRDPPPNEPTTSGTYGDYSIFFRGSPTILSGSTYPKRYTFDWDGQLASTSGQYFTGISTEYTGSVDTYPSVAFPANLYSCGIFTGKFICPLVLDKDPYCLNVSGTNPVYSESCALVKKKCTEDGIDTFQYKVIKEPTAVSGTDAFYPNYISGSKVIDYNLTVINDLIDITTDRIWSVLWTDPKLADDPVTDMERFAWFMIAGLDFRTRKMSLEDFDYYDWIEVGDFVMQHRPSYASSYGMIGRCKVRHQASTAFWFSSDAEMLTYYTDWTSLAGQYIIRKDPDVLEMDYIMGDDLSNDLMTNANIWGITRISQYWPKGTIEVDIPYTYSQKYISIYGQSSYNSFVVNSKKQAYSNENYGGEG